MDGEFVRLLPGGTDVAVLDARTLAYVEMVSGKRGQAALDAWLRYTGWRDESDLPLRRRLIKSNGHLREVVAGPRSAADGARSRTSVETRVEHARRRAALFVRK